jgi:hypothetical protein
LINYVHVSLCCSASWHSSMHFPLLARYCLFAFGYCYSISSLECIIQWSDISVQWYSVLWSICLLHKIQSVIDCRFLVLRLNVYWLLPRFFRCLRGWVLVLKFPVIMMSASGLHCNSFIICFSISLMNFFFFWWLLMSLLL